MKPIIFRTFILLVVFFTCLLGFGQGGWKKKYSLQNSLTSVCRNVVEAPNGNFIMVGLTYDTINNPGTNRLTIVGTDAQGNMLWRKDYGRYNFEYLDNSIAPEGAVVFDESNFYHTLVVRDSNNKYIGVLLKFDYNGDTIWQKIYRDPARDLIPQGICKSVDGGFIITGSFQDWANNTNPCLLLKTDINGNELWRKSINKAPPNVHDGLSLVQDSTTKKIVVVGYQYVGANSDNYGNILIFDSIGNVLTQTTANNAGGGGLVKIIQLADKNFMTCGTMNANSDFGGIPRWRNFAAKFDINGGLIWRYVYDTLSRFTISSHLFEFENGNLLMAGYIDTTDNYGLSGPVKPKIYFIDKNGASISERYIGSAYTFTSSQYVLSLCRTVDKGFVLATNFVNSPSSSPRPYRIIKIDSTGCDTSEAYCKWQESLGISDIYRLHGFGMEIFPNPAIDYVNIKIAAPNKKNYRIAFSSADGRILYIAEVDTDGTTLIETGTCAPGVYLVSLMDGAKILQTNKLIISP